MRAGGLQKPEDELLPYPDQGCLKVAIGRALAAPDPLSCPGKGERYWTVRIRADQEI